MVSREALGGARGLARRVLNRAQAPLPAGAPTPTAPALRARSRSSPLAVVAEPVDGGRWSACYAPHSSIYFDQRGKARACCQNTGTYLGDVTGQSLREIWDSAQAEALRSALEADDYSQGCDFCEWQVREGNEAILFARQYDGLEPAEHRPRWPTQMEFALTNTCNLQCVMCNGEWSSAIRSRREQLPPLPAVYGEAFFDQLAEFLPHLTSAKFAGGEPFLGAEPLRVMEMLAALDHPPEVTIITNGTIASPRVRRILGALKPKLIVSIDGASPATYDVVRVGAHLPDVLANVDRFRAELGPGKVSITTCLMTANWHEFADLLALAEDRDLDVGVNVVRFPAEHSLYQLSADELATVVATLDGTDVELTGGRLSAWTGQRAALTQRLAVLRTDDPHLGPAHGLAGASHGPAGPLVPAPTSRWPWLPFPEEATRSAGTAVPSGPGPAAVFAIDVDGKVSVVRIDPGVPVDVDGLDGDNVAELADRLLAAFPDPSGWVLADRWRPVDDDRFWLWLGAAGQEPVAEMIGTSTRDLDGNLEGATYTIRPVTARTANPWTDEKSMA